MRTVIIGTLVVVLLASAATGRVRHRSVPDTRAFIPTKEAQVAQNLMIERYSLRRIKNEAELSQAISQRYVAPIKSSNSIALSPKLPRIRRYALPSTVSFLNQIALVYYATFGQPLVVTSAVRPLTVQSRLLRWNRNAAPLHGEVASSHPTGATIDLSRRSMTRAQTRFMESLLLMHASLGRIIVLEERRQMCFHIFVIPIKEPTL